MNILVACEFSGIVRDAFIARGHNAVSCDLVDTIAPGPHIIDDVRNHLSRDWQAVIAFPPCTYLCSSGARWWNQRRHEQALAIQFFLDLYNAPCDHVCVENPIGIMSTAFRKPDQIIQPWQFGHGEVKSTCLWLRGLPQLVPTDIVDGRHPRIHLMPPSPKRSMLRSITYKGIAEAMADQWLKGM